MKTALPRLLAVVIVIAAATLTCTPAMAKATFAAPHMGWSSWSVQSSTNAAYGTKWLNEANIRRTADAMAGKLKAAGYTRVNLDAGWNATLDWNFHSDANGIPDPEPARFPNGIKPLADYVHGLGLKIGLYGAAGLEKEAYDRNVPILGTSCRTKDIAVLPLTPTNMWKGNWKIDYTKSCAQAYINSIANRYASWGVDFVKIDGVDTENTPDIAAWSAAIDQSGRQMWLTASAWPIPQQLAAGLRPHANSVRVDTDVECYCDTVSNWANSIDNRWDDLPNWLPEVRPNYWPDLDSMPISNNTGSGIQDGLNDVERQSVMTYWSMASSPLYVGGDIANLDSTAIAILTNPEVIAVDQSGVIPTRVAGGTLQKWRKQLPDGSVVAAVYNLGASPADITLSWSELGIGGTQRVRDLVSRGDLGAYAGGWTANNVPAHGSRLVKLTGSAALTAYEAEGQTLSGGARLADCSTCSGGKKVGYLGGNGTLRFNGVKSGQRVTVFYATADPRSADISVNGGPPTRVDFAATGGWNTVASKEIPLALSAGTNTITFANPAGWSPDIDKIAV